MLETRQLFLLAEWYEQYDYACYVSNRLISTLSPRNLKPFSFRQFNLEFISCAYHYDIYQAFVLTCTFEIDTD